MTSEPGQIGAAITPADIQAAEQQTLQKPTRPQNRKNRTPLKRLIYMREYNKRRKMAKLADECGYIKVSNDATPEELKNAAKKAVTASDKNGFDRDGLLHRFEALARSGNDMAAIAALKAYAEYAGIGPENRAEGVLTPDQAKGYADRLRSATQARLGQTGAVVVQILTSTSSDRFEGSTIDALQWVNSRLSTTTGSVDAGNNSAQDIPLSQQTQAQDVVNPA